MNTSIEHPSKGRVSPTNKLDPEPGDHGHDGVVNHVQGGEMSPFLPQDKEYGVKEVNDLGEEEKP